MTTQQKNMLTVEATVQAPLQKVWDYWTKPEHITQWNYASDDWQCPRSKNDLREGGRFSARMEAKDGSMGFDFSGVYDIVDPSRYIEYHLDDNRKVMISFATEGNGTKVTEQFEAEQTHSLEMQQGGWQAILDNFKKYTEAN